MFKQEEAFFISDDNVGKFFIEDRTGDDLRADAGIVIDEIGNKLGLAFGRPDEFEPIKEGWIVGFGIAAMRAMCPKSFAGDNVFETVAIHID